MFNNNIPILYFVFKLYPARTCWFFTHSSILKQGQKTFLFPLHVQASTETTTNSCTFLRRNVLSKKCTFYCLFNTKRNLRFWKLGLHYIAQHFEMKKVVIPFLLLPVAFIGIFGYWNYNPLKPSVLDFSCPLI